MTGLKREVMDLYLSKLLDYILTKVQIVEYEIGKQSECYCEGRDSDFWSAVINMIGLALAQEEADEAGVCKKLCTAQQKAYALADSYEFNHQITVLFREAFDQSIPEVCKLVPEASAAELSEQDLSRTVLYNSAHYYIPEKLFAEICRSLSEVATVNQIKDVLATEGILCTQGRDEFTEPLRKLLEVQIYSPDLYG